MNKENKEKSKFKLITKFCRKFDNFGTQIEFRVGKHSQYTSSFGGFIFSFYFVIALAYVVYNFIQFASRNLFTLSYSSKILSPTPEIKSLENLSFAFSINFPNYTVLPVDLLDNFEFSVNFRSRKGIVSTYENIKKKFCTINDFLFQKTEFYTIGLDRAYCIEDGNFIKNHTIRGADNELEKSEYELSVLIKRDRLNLVKELMKSPLLFFFIIRDGNVDYEKIDSTITYRYNVYASYIDLKFHKIFKLKIANLEFSSDDNILFPHKEVEEGFLTDSFGDDFYYLEDRNISNNFFIISFSISASNRLIIYERTYQKLSEFFANMTGLLSQFALIFYFIINYVNEKGAQQKVMTKLMKYKDNPNFDVDLLLNLFSNKICYNVTNRMSNKNCRIESTSNRFFNKQTNTMDKSIDITNNKSNTVEFQKVQDINLFPSSPGDSRKKYRDETEKKTESSKKKLNSFEIFLSIFRCSSVLRNKVILLEKGEKKVSFYMDVMTYIKKMQEIDILKYVILSQDQLNLFNFLSKPSILTNDSKNPIFQQFELEQKYNKRILKENIEAIFLSYNNIIEKDLTQQNSKLLNLFNSEIENFKN